METEGTYYNNKILEENCYGLLNQLKGCYFKVSFIL